MKERMKCNKGFKDSSGSGGEENDGVGESERACGQVMVTPLDHRGTGGSSALWESL